MQVYLDNAASTRVSKPVIELMNKAMDEDYANPSAKHLKGMEAEKYLKEAAIKIAKTMKVSEKELVFTSGGTESNNMALIGAAMARQRYGKHIISTAIEHSAVHQVLVHLADLGFEYSILKVDEKGQISLEELKSLLRADTILVSVMYVNNEIGAVQDIKAIADIVHGYNKDIYMHTDAIQAYGKFKIFPKKEGIDLLSVSAHKLHGPKGSGFLYIDERVNIKPIIYGGGQQRGFRSGTLNIPGIAGLGEAAKEAYEDFDKEVEYIYGLRDYLIDEITKLNDEGIKLNSDKGVKFAPHVLSISISGVRAEVLLHSMEERGIYIASGSACSSNHPGLSGTLKGIGLKEEFLSSTVRVSFSKYNNKEELDFFLANLKELIPQLRRYK
jgi:hypothetical protein